jgi:cysteine-rich repeat protein
MTLLVGLLVAGAPVAARAMNLTGTWEIGGVGFPSLGATIVQTGTALSVTTETSTLPGTIDSATGAFSFGTGSRQSCDTFQFVGVAAADGNSMAGTVTLDVPVQGCSEGVFSFTGTRSTCGNGHLDPGEQCDDGNLDEFDCCVLCGFVPAGSGCESNGVDCTAAVCDGAGSCTHPPASAGTPCSSDGVDCTSDVCDESGTCTHPVAPAGASCADDGHLCTANSCDGAGVCIHTLLPAGAVCRGAAGPCYPVQVCDGASPDCLPDLPPDSDGDGLPDACDPCMGGVSLDGPRIRLATYHQRAGNDVFKASAELALAPVLLPSLDPVAHGLRVLIGNPFASSLLDFTLPPGGYDPATRTGWSASRSLTSWRFKTADPSLAATRARIDESKRVPGLVSVKLSGKRRSFADQLPPEPLRFTVVLDPPVAAGGLCGDVDIGLVGGASCTFGKNVLDCR